MISGTASFTHLATTSILSSSLLMLDGMMIELGSSLEIGVMVELLDG